jgi:2-polyprenyl-3-methyl-5-hydroxy-6-metoxy-1,4-benzoquinol methylase
MSDERVVPGETPVLNLMRHMARYNLALQFANGKRVLDTACGTGYGTQLLSLSADELVGWDIDKETVEYAKKNFSNEKISYYVQDMEKVKKPKEVGLHSKFDTIVSFETIEHLKDPEAFLSKSTEMLNKDGVMVASVPLNEPKGFNEHHLHVFTYETAKKMFEKNYDMLAEVTQSNISFYPPNIKGLPSHNIYYIFIGKKR